MVLVELIGSISLAIAFLSAIALAILHLKNKQNIITYINNHHQQQQQQQQSAIENDSKELPIINVVQNEEIISSPIKYGIQWTKPEIEFVKTTEFDQGDSVSFSDQTQSVRELIVKFENNIKEKRTDKEKSYQTDSDLTSLHTNFDNQTIKTDFNQNRQKYSHHSSISNLDVTIPSNLSSSIDLEQFECISNTSNLSEFLIMN